MTEQTDNIIIAHSLGGIMSQDYLDSQINISQNNIKQLVLLGCTMARKYRRIQKVDGKTWINHQMKDTLTVLGTKDGLLRVTRGVEAYYHQ